MATTKMAQSGSGQAQAISPHRRGLFGAGITLVALLFLWWLANRWFHASLIAEEKGQLALVERSVWALQITGLLVVCLGTTLAYIITSRQVRLAQTVQSQEFALAEREAQYRSIFQTTQEALVIRDLETLRIVDANAAYCALHQTDRAALLGSTQAIVTDEDSYRRYAAIIQQTGQHRWEETLSRSGAPPLYVEAVGTTITYHGQPHLLVALRDVTDRVQAHKLLEERVARRTRELETLLQVSRDLTGTLDLKTLVGRILEQLRQVVDYDSARVFDLVDGSQLRLLLYAGPGGNSQVAELLPLGDYPIHQQIIAQRRPWIIADTQTETPEARTWRAAMGTSDGFIRAWLGVPLLLKDRPVGLLACGHRQVKVYKKRHAELALAFAAQAAIAIENARLYEQAQTLASLEERRHLARELHDSVSQALYGIALGTRTARVLLDQNPDRLAEPLDYIMNLAEAGLTEMRALIFELRPEILESEGLVVALGKQAEALQIRHKLEVVTNLGPEPDAPLAAKEALYRIAQEATHNIVKHAKAGQVTLTLTADDGLTLKIEDDGQGFDPGQSFPGHLGLHSMRERVAKLDGHFELESEPGRGTTVRVWLPIT